MCDYWLFGLTRLKFNYSDFKRKWKERAAHFGIDPEYGASSYQVALVTAEARKRATWARMSYRWDGLPWWANPDMWEEDRPRDRTEKAALANMQAAAKRLQPQQEEELPVDMLTLRELWVEVKREIARDLTAPERDLLQWLPTAAELTAEVAADSGGLDSMLQLN